MQKRLRDSKGATAVEFALVMVPLFYVLFGIIQYGLYFYAMQVGSSTAADATRRLSVGDCQTPGALQTYVNSRLASATASTSLITESVSYLTSVGVATTAPGQVGGSVTLTITYPVINLHFPLIPLPSGGTVTRSAVSRLESITPTESLCL